MIIFKRENVSNTVYISILISIISFLIIVTGFFIRISLWNEIDADGKKSYSVNGTVAEISLEGNDPVVILKRLKINGKTVNGRIAVSIQDSDENGLLKYVGIGDNVSFSSVVYCYDMVDNFKVNSYAIRTNQRYASYVSYNNIKFSPSDPDFMSSLRLKIIYILNNALGKEYGGLANGMLTGDKTGIYEKTYSAFSTSGLAHILTVSGIHIGFLSTILSFIFKSLKLKNSTNAILSLAFFIFYIILSDFSAPVIRAVIMFEVLTFSRLFSKQYDAMSSLFFALVLILLCQPFSLFDASFVLSAAAMFGIILFAVSLENTFKKIWGMRLLSKALAVVIAAQIGVLPALMYYFKEIQTYAILTNIILMPLITITFTGLIISLMLTFIFPFMSIFLSITGLGLSLVSDAAILVSKLPFAVIPINPTELILLCYIDYFLISRFFMKRKEVKFSSTKIISVCTSFALFFSGCMVFQQNVPKNYLIPLASYGSLTTIVGTAEQTYIVGDFYSNYEAQRAMLDTGKTRVEVIYLNSLSEQTAKALVSFCEKFKVKKILCPSNTSLEGLTVLLNADISNFYLFDSYDDIGSGFKPIFDKNNKFLAYQLQTPNKSVLLCSSKINYSEISHDILNNTSIIVAKLFQNIYYERIYITSIPTGYLGEVPRYQYSTAELGTFLLDLDTGKLMYKK